jgi:hypothetical protein
MDKITEAGVTILMAVVGVAILAVIVSRNSQTPQVLSSFGQMFSGILGTAVSPVTGTGLTGGGSMGIQWPQYTSGLQGGFPTLGY